MKVRSRVDAKWRKRGIKLWLKSWMNDICFVVVLPAPEIIMRKNVFKLSVLCSFPFWHPCVPSTVRLFYFYFRAFLHWHRVKKSFAFCYIFFNSFFPSLLQNFLQQVYKGRRLYVYNFALYKLLKVVLTYAKTSHNLKSNVFSQSPSLAANIKWCYIMLFAHHGMLFGSIFDIIINWRITLCLKLKYRKQLLNWKWLVLVQSFETLKIRGKWHSIVRYDRDYFCIFSCCRKMWKMILFLIESWQAKGEQHRWILLKFFCLSVATLQT